VWGGQERVLDALATMRATIPAARGEESDAAR